MAIHLDTTLCALQAVPCIVAIARGKDPTTRTVCGVICAVDIVLGFGPYVGVHLEGLVFQIICAALGALGIFAAVRVAQPVLSSLIVASGVLLALIGLRLVSLSLAN